eukprot:1027735-Prymnesium_polylepis.1
MSALAAGRNTAGSGNLSRVPAAAQTQCIDNSLCTMTGATHRSFAGKCVSDSNFGQSRCRLLHL